MASKINELVNAILDPSVPLSETFQMFESLVTAK